MLKHTQCSQQRTTNTLIHTETHIGAYLEFHNEMCEVEFSLQVQSDADILLSCGGSNYHSASEQHISCVSLVSWSQNRPDCLTKGDLYISFCALLSLLQHRDYITIFSLFLLSVSQQHSRVFGIRFTVKDFVKSQQIVYVCYHQKQRNKNKHSPCTNILSYMYEDRGSQLSASTFVLLWSKYTTLNAHKPLTDCHQVWFPLRSMR